MHGGVKSRGRAPTSRPLPPCLSRARLVDRPHSTFAPFALAWIAPCDVRIISFTSKINHRLAPPPGDPELKLKVRFCVRGVASPFLANVYLHYIHDVWVQVWRKRHASGDTLTVRYADDSVAGFQYHSEAVQFLQDLTKRLAVFGLRLHPEKTRLIEFGRFAIKRRA